MSGAQRPPRHGRATRPIERWLRNQGRAQRSMIAAAVCAGLLDVPLVIGQAWLLASILDAVILKNTGLGTLGRPLGILLGVLTARALFSGVRGVLAFEAAARVKHQLRCDLFAHLLACGPLAARAQRSGQVAHRVADAIESMDRYYRDYLPQVGLAAALPLVLLAVIFPADWVSGLIMVLTAPLVPLFMILIGKGTQTLNQRQWRRLARMSAHLFDTIEGLTTLKLFGAARREIAVVAEMSEGYRRDTLAILRLAFVSSLMLEFVVTLSIAMVAVYIGFRLYYGEMAFLPGLFVLLLAPEFYKPLRETGSQYHARMEAIGAAEGLIEAFDIPMPAFAGPSGVVLPHATHVVFDGVAFHYPEARVPVFSGVELTLERGRMTALVGPSGAGKTTLAYLLLGFARPSAGRIVVDGRDLGDIALDDWLSQVAWVPQRPTLFHGTIADNIRLARPAATDHDVRRAAQAADAARFIETLPAAYDTTIGDLGQGLSGGQIQRIALARAFLAEARVIVLDEPSASLDPDSEARLDATLARLARDRMLLVIAHRLNTVCRAEEIVLLADGGIVERGTHAKLMAARGRYAQLWSLYRGASAEATTP